MVLMTMHCRSETVSRKSYGLNRSRMLMDPVSRLLQPVSSQHASHQYWSTFCCCDNTAKAGCCIKQKEPFSTQI